MSTTKTHDLKHYASLDDADIDLAEMVFGLVAPFHEGVSIERYVRQTKKIFEDVGARHEALLAEGAEDDARTRLASLKYVISDQHGYDVVDGESLEVADLMRVIDLGKGNAAALCVLYMDAARKMGWEIEGLNFPKVFLCRLEKDGERVIFNPSQGCKMMEAHDLRALVKEGLGEEAELSNAYYDGLGARDTAVHLCNALKLRHIEMGDYRAALELVLRMREVAPDEYRLLLDAGVLHARLNQRDEAVGALEMYVDQAPDYYDRHEALMLLDELRS